VGGRRARRIEYPNDKLEDVVIVRSDGRPTYNFARRSRTSGTGITHVIRGDDHIPNTPKQINIIRAVGATCRSTATCPM
jgi:glutamyl-tRNA synthetase